MSPLIAKSVAAVLYDLEFLDGLLFTMEVYILYWALPLIYFMFLWQQTCHHLHLT